MEIQVAKLRETMELMKPVIPKKATLNVVTFLCLGNGKAVGTDLTTMVIADLPEAVEPILLPYAAIAEMLKYVPGNETLKIEEKSKKVVSLSWNGGSASYPTEDPRDFPILPEMPAKAEGEIDGDILIAAMLAALPYATTDTARPTLCGVTLVLGNPVEVAAGDGFRMCHQVLGLSFPLEEKVIVPEHSVAILEHVFAKTPRTPPSTADSLIKVITAKRQLHVALAGVNKLRLDFGTSASVVINLIAGSPPAWLQLIPKGEPILQSQLFAPQLEAAVRRVRIVAKDGSGIVRLVFADGKVTVSAKGDDREISATLDTLNTQGEPGRTAINQKYLLEYLSGKQGIVILSKYTDNGPVVFQYQNAPRVIIMPMTVQWGDEKPKEEPQAEPVAVAATTAETPEAEATQGTTEAEAEGEADASAEGETTGQEAGEEEPADTE